MRFDLHIALALSSVLSANAAPLPGEAEGRLTLEQAKQYAMQHNYEVKARRLDWEQTVAGAKRARAPFYPRLGVAGGADSLTGVGFENTGPVANVYISMNLFNGFTDSILAHRTDLLAEKAHIQYQRAEFRVGLDVEQEFHTLLFKKCQWELNQEALKLNKQQQKMALARRASGMAAESDVLEFDQREALLKSEAYSLEQEIEEVRAQLRRLLGEEVGESVQPVGHLQHQHLQGTLMDFMQKMRSENESILVGAKDVSVADLDAGLWRASWLPKLDVEARGGYLSLDYRPSSGAFNFIAMAYLKWELFSGFDSIWQREETLKKKQAAEARLKDAILTAVTQMEIAYRRIKTIQHRVDLEEKNAARSEKYYKVVLGEYRRGVKNSADLRVAAEAIYATGVRKKQFQYDFLMEKIKLERALGSSVKTILVQDE